MASCSPPKSQSVKTHTRSKPRKRRVAGSAPAGAAKRGFYYVVKDTNTGRIVSKHRDWLAASRVRRRLDLKSYRTGRGRPFDIQRVEV